MIVHVNGKALRVDDGATVTMVLASLDVGPARRGLAVAVDAEVVPRGSWDEHALAEGARIELLTAIQGGA
ncbi:MAG: sulfur carrier protein ThiS [Actinomycetota bacterium]|nr:sulfur carrier protein ThiS [Actinomycetota bacterium]